MVDRPGSKIVTMYADGTLELDGRRMDISQITAALIPAVQNYPDLKVQFRPDVGANIGQASQVMEAISRAGVRDLGWTTTASRMPSSSIR
jgi:biopolymer transport protein ExbD